MAPAFVVLVLYPRGPSTTFDFQDFLSKHVSIVKEVWGPYGLKIHSVSETGEESGYHCICVLEWPSKEAYAKAQLDVRTNEIHADGAKGRFTTAMPMFLEGRVVA